MRPNREKLNRSTGISLMNRFSLNNGGLSIPRRLFGVLSYHNASNLRHARLMGVLHLLGVLTRCHLRCILRSKAAVSFEYGVVGTADFVKIGHGGRSFRLWDERWASW